MKASLCMLAVLSALTQLKTARGSVCKPLSTFKIDCNICRCSSNGLEYSCTTEICQPINPDDFIQEVNDQGFLILKPKPVPKPPKIGDSDESYVLRRPQSRLYINDQIIPSSYEMPPEIQGNNEIDAIPENELIDDEDDVENEGNIEDVNMERDSENWEEDNYDTLRRIIYRSL